MTVLNLQIGRLPAVSTPDVEKLIEEHMPLIEAVASTYRSTPHVDRRELLQEGVVGLLRARERYDPARGVPFAAYAVWWIRQAMQQLVAELTRPVVLSDRALRHLARLRDAMHEVLRETGREPDASDLAARTGLTEEQVAALLAAEGRPRSLDEPIVGEDGRVTTFGDLLADPLAEDAYGQVLTALEAGTIRELMTSLSDRERAVLTARHEQARPLRDVAGELGLSAERVRQIEARALGKLAAGAPR